MSSEFCAQLGDFEAAPRGRTTSGALLDLPHPYPRYGLAVALFEAQVTPDDVTEENLGELLAQAIETGLEHFRMTTADDPALTRILRFSYVGSAQLRADRRIVYSNGLSECGVYLAPTVITNEIDKKQGQIIRGTFEKSVHFIEALRSGTPLSKPFELGRSFAPTTSKINNGVASQTPPKGTLLEGACSAIATLTPLKPAARVQKSNTALKPAARVKRSNTTIIPDLPLAGLLDFIELFTAMTKDELDGSLMEARLPTPKEPPKVRRKAKAGKGPEKAKQSEYRRPRLHSGNYPYAPRNQVFGPAGLLGAIGKWARRANKTDWARGVLESIAGTEKRPGVPLYIVSYESITQVRFAHHVVDLSIEGKLSDIINSVTRETDVYSEIDDDKPRWESTAYGLFYLMANRFLQLFSLPAFRDFLATRAEYSSGVHPLFEEYFMNARKIDNDIVQSARALGQWLNRAAWVVADSETKESEPERDKKVRKEKAKILVEFESAAMSAKSPQDMLHRVSTRAGRLLQRDLPAEATRFMDATASGELAPEDSLHLLIGFLRLRSGRAEQPGVSAADAGPMTSNA